MIEVILFHITVIAFMLLLYKLGAGKIPLYIAVIVFMYMLYQLGFPFCEWPSWSCI